LPIFKRMIGRKIPSLRNPAGSFWMSDHRALCAAAIFLRAAGDGVRFLPIRTTFALCRNFAQRAFELLRSATEPRGMAVGDLFLLNKLSRRRRAQR
jgi:hypothetical protein